METTRKRYGINPEPPELKPTGRYTATDAANILGLSRRTVTRAIAAGNLRAINPMDTRKRFLGRELRRYWDSVTR